jgi:hypothetical protein
VVYNVAYSVHLYTTDECLNDPGEKYRNTMKSIQKHQCYERQVLVCLFIDEGMNKRRVG